MKGSTNSLIVVSILTATTVVLFCAPAFSATSAEKETLRGVKALNVLVKARIVDEGAKVLGITEEQLRADTQETLEKAGIQIANNVRPYLLLSVSILSISHPTVDGILAYVYTAQLRFRQGAVIDSTGKRASVTTWDETRFGAATPAKFLDIRIRQSIRALTDAFVKDYLAENPAKEIP